MPNVTCPPLRLVEARNSAEGVVDLQKQQQQHIRWEAGEIALPRKRKGGGETGTAALLTQSGYTTDEHNTAAL